MNANRRRAAWMSWGLASVVWALVMSGAAVATAQSTQPALVPAGEAPLPGEPAAEPAPGGAEAGKVGVIKGNDVYVRSGFSTNYYAVAKLGRGTEVTVLGEEFGWLKIAPPPGTHSLVDKTYVDVLEDKTGAANDGVWVYAGSNIDKRRYAKQVKLQKGDRVKIIGETEDGTFYKIVPPPGAGLWVSGEFVDRSGKTARAESPTPPTIEPVKPGELKLTQSALPGTGVVPGKEPAVRGGAGLGVPTTGPAKGKATAGPAAPAGSAPRTSRSLASTDKYQVMIDALQAEIVAENHKPMAERNFEPIVVKLEEIAGQTEDEIAQLYAHSRIKQIREHMDLIAAVREMRELTENAVSVADEAARARAKIREKAVPPMDTIAVRGQIRVSGIYDGSGSRPKRWRVVDASGGKTVAYIEVPKGSPIDPVQYYGKYVGVRASEHHLLHGTVPPVPIYTVEEVVVLDPAGAPMKGPPGVGGEAPTVEASPTPMAVPAPTTQPAGVPATGPAAL